MKIFSEILRCEASSLREGFFSRRSNLTTIATSVRIRIASFLAMTILLLEHADGNLFQYKDPEVNSG